MALQESFADKFLNLILKSKSDSGSNRFLISLLKLNPKLNKSLGGLNQVLKDTEKWAERQRKIDPDFVQAEKEIDKIWKDS